MPDGDEKWVVIVIGRSSQFARSALRVSVVTLSGVFFAFGVANAELPTPDLSEDPQHQVLDQIMTMMTQENAALRGLTANRLAELGGLSASQLSDDAPQMSTLSIFGFGKPSENVSTSAPETLFTKTVLDTMPAASGDRQWQCLTEAMYFESRSETLEGQFAVGEVILNRVDSRRFPNSVCGVVTQGAHRLHACQFSYNCDGKAEHFSEPRALARSGKLAKMLIEGRARVLTGGATYYHTTAVNPSWASSFTQTAQIGEHLFYSAQ